eukprot:7816139-Alexandrium_andersonii.AAC.1
MAFLCGPRPARGVRTLLECTRIANNYTPALHRSCAHRLAPAKLLKHSASAIPEYTTRRGVAW